MSSFWKENNILIVLLVLSNFFFKIPKTIPNSSKTVLTSVLYNLDFEIKFSGYFAKDHFSIEIITFSDSFCDVQKCH